MSLFEYFSAEWHKLLSNMVVAAIAFFLSFLAKNLIDEWKERKLCREILRAIQSEAEQNQIVLANSFIKYNRGGLVLRELSTTAVLSALMSSTFIKHVENSSRTVLSEYFRNIDLSNRYREKIDKIRFSDDYFERAQGATLKHWEPLLLNAWQKNMSACSNSITEVCSIKWK